MKLMKTPLFVLRSGLALASACLALACSNLAPTNTQTSSSTPVPAPSIPPPATPAAQNPEDKMPRVSAEETKKLVDASKAVVIDVRGTDAYKISHIKGALDYPLSKIEAKDFSGLPKGKRIIAYCT